MLDIKKIHIPTQPGCYVMKNKAEEIIYIGKAKNLSKRVKNYWQKKHNDWKTIDLVREINNLDFIITRTEVEALLLEARLIKQHQPRFNFKLKENQPFMYIKITEEEFPQLVSVRKIEGPGKYFGPYTSGKARRSLLFTTSRLFGIRTGKLISKSGKELYKLLSQIKEKNLDQISSGDYAKNVKLAELFLKGQKDQVAEELEKRMKLASAEQNFELAKLYHNQIRAIRQFSEKQLISVPKSYDQDIINYVDAGDQTIIQIFNVNKGVVTSRKEYKVERQSEMEGGVIFSFLEQYYLTRPIPKEIILPEKIAEEGLIVKYLSELAKQKIQIIVPQKGDRFKLLQLVRQNILSKLADSPLKQLQAACNLPRLPIEIDGFDISNISGQEAVGSCVHFSDGESNKNLYRKFKIKTVRGINDYAMMKEVISRRYLRTEWPAPDLILIDGGKGQLNVALKVLKELKLDFPVISLAKRLEEVFIPYQSEPIILDKNSLGLKLLQRIRNEAHRFAISYHKLLMKKRGK